MHISGYIRKAHFCRSHMKTDQSQPTINYYRSLLYPYGVANFRYVCNYTFVHNSYLCLGACKIFTSPCAADLLNNNLNLLRHCVTESIYNPPCNPPMQNQQISKALYIATCVHLMLCLPLDPTPIAFVIN